MSGYADLAADGINLALFRVREALNNGHGTVGEYDIHPDDLQPCSTAQHKGQKWASRPSVKFSVALEGGRVYVCRYCLKRIAHARLTRDTETEQALLDLARPHKEALSILIDDAGHLTSSESLVELHWFARLLGLKSAWFQNGKHAHYDVMGKTKHAQAVRLGARVVNPGLVAEASRRLAREREGVNI